MNYFIKYAVALLLIMKVGFITAQIAKKEKDICPIKVGTKLENLPEVKDTSGKKASLDLILKGKQTLLIIYRGAWCPYCNRQLASIQNIEKKILDLGYQIVAVSVDAPKIGYEMIGKNKLKYQVFFDPTTKFVQSLGIAFKAIPIIRPNLKKYSNYINKERAVPVPSIFIVGENKNVLFNYSNINYKKRIPNRLLLSALKTYKKQ